MPAGSIPILPAGSRIFSQMLDCKMQSSSSANPEPARECFDWQVDYFWQQQEYFANGVLLPCFASS